VRAKADFLTLCKTPELAAEVTLQPVDIVGVDAAIIFSDILVVPEAMGMHLIVEEGKGGPRFGSRIEGRADIDRLVEPDPHDRLRYVMDALSLSRKELNGRVPLIGFSGSPWTLACYMIEGAGSKSWSRALAMAKDAPVEMHRLLARLSRTVSSYLAAQIEAGAQVLQIFDTWGGILPPAAFEEFSLRYIREIVGALPAGRAPVIVFCKDCGHAIEQIAGTGCQAVGLDAAVDIGEARAAVGATVALQGNLDPSVLRSEPGAIREAAGRILASYGSGSGHVFNLGHGITPDVPVDHVRELVNFVRTESAKYHATA
jgi:uroporphyrinogen decarboxylase